MVNAAFRKRKEKWNRFIQWEAGQKTSTHPQKTLQLIGEWIDFFWLRHPKQSEPAEIQGVRKMQHDLSRLSRTE